MEELGCGGGYRDRSRHHRHPPPSDRFLGAFNQHLPPTVPSHALELSEQDIFNTPSGSSSSSYPKHSVSGPNRNRTGQEQTSNHRGILAALNDNARNRSGSDNRPVFNHKASAPVSLPSSSSTSTSPATSSSSRMMIPRKPPPPPPVERMRLRHQSAPVDVPVIPAALMRRPGDLEIVVSEDEEESNVVLLPPHEVVAARESPMLANSVLEGVGRTLKGRDLRQVRNAVWRKTGFLD